MNTPQDFPLIPSAEQIAELAKERADQARMHDDTPGARALDRMRMNVLNGARLRWHLSDLLIQSVNNPGSVYSVNRSSCTCPNGAAGKATCWHICLFDLLLDMRETAADTADIDADACEICDDAGCSECDGSELTDEEVKVQIDPFPAAEAAQQLGRRLALARAAALEFNNELFAA